MKIILSPQVNNVAEELVISITGGSVSCTPAEYLLSDEPAGEFKLLMPIKSDATEAECWPTPIEVEDTFEGTLDYKSLLVSCKPEEV